MIRLLKADSAGPEAEEVHKHHREVMRQIFASDERREVNRVVREIMDSNVHVTLEIRADVPEGIPEKVERDVSE